MFHFSTRRVGGLRFIKLGRFCISFCVTRTYIPLWHNSLELFKTCRRFIFDGMQRKENNILWSGSLHSVWLPCKVTFSLALCTARNKLAAHSKPRACLRS